MDKQEKRKQLINPDLPAPVALRPDDLEAVAAAGALALPASRIVIIAGGIPAAQLAAVAAPTVSAV